MENLPVESSATLPLDRLGKHIWVTSEDLHVMSDYTAGGSVYWSRVRREHTLEVSMLLIRPAVRNDVDLLKALIHEMGEYERLPVLITEETLERDGFGPRPEFRVLIADWDCQPAGYAFFFNCYSTFRGRGLFLEDLFVRPQFRGKKVGDALLSHLAVVAQHEACFGIMLNVLGWNRPAIEFFQKHRATFLDDWKTACFDGEAMQFLAATR